MSETVEGPDDGDEREHRDPSKLSDKGLGATASNEPNTFEPEEALPEEDD
jgi:hypothetical protein